MRAFSALLVLLALGCSPELPDEFACDETCDRSGPLQLSDTWVPVGGFVRATISGDHALEVSAGAVVEDREDGRYIIRFPKSGYFKVVAGSGTLFVRVADEGPTIVLDPIGDEGFATVGPVDISGRLVEPLPGKTRLRLRGETISVDSKGRFQTSVDATFGLSILDFVVIDAAENQFQEPKAFVAASDYGHVSSRLNFRISPTALDQLAVELSAGLPSLLSTQGGTAPVYESFLADIYIDSYEFPEVANVEMIPSNGRLRLSIKLDKPIVVRGRIDMASDSTYRAELEGLQVEGYVRFDTEAGQRLVAYVEDVVVRSSGLDIDESSIIPDGAITWMIGNVDDEVAELINSDLPGILTSTVASAAGTFDVNVPNQSDELEGVYALKDLRFDSDGGEVELGASIEMPSYSGGGPPIKNAAPPAMPKSEDAVFLGLNLLNKYLYALWRAEGFHRSYDESDLEKELEKIGGLSGLDPIIDIDIVAMKPPVATSDKDGAMLSIGEVAVTVSVSTDFFQVTAFGTLSARASLHGAIEDYGLRLGTALEEIHVDIDQVAFAGLDTERLEALVESVAPKLFADWANKLRVIKLPTFDLQFSGRDGRYFGLENAAARTEEAGIVFVGVATAYSN